MSEQYIPGIAILASGSGTTAEAIIRATQTDVLNAQVQLVVSNNSEAGVFGRVAKLNEEFGLDIQTAHISGKTHPKGALERGQTYEESEAIADLVQKFGCAHVLLAGYMKRVNGPLMREYGWRPWLTSAHQARMINTHPGPLPETTDTYGVAASQRVLQLGMAASRHTVHIAAPNIDEGPIVAEHPVPVIPGDTPETLFGRVQLTEKEMLPVALDRFLREQQAYHG